MDCPAATEQCARPAAHAIIEVRLWRTQSCLRAGRRLLGRDISLSSKYVIGMLRGAGQQCFRLRARDLESAIEKYLEYVGSTRLDRSEPIEDDEQAQAELASDLSEAFDDAVHSHSDKIEKRWTSGRRAMSRKAQW
jgi:hypothetical protein